MARVADQARRRSLRLRTPSCCCRMPRASCSYPETPALPAVLPRRGSRDRAMGARSRPIARASGPTRCPLRRALYLPLRRRAMRSPRADAAPARRAGRAARQQRRVLLPEQLHLLETFAGQIGLALERAQLAEEAETARVSAETESLRNTLLASISHDLRTPLAVIAGAAQHARRSRRDAEARRTRVSLARSIEAKAREMSELISNVLDLMRFEAGEVNLRRDWQTLDDLVGTALSRCEQPLARHIRSRCRSRTSCRRCFVDAGTRRAAVLQPARQSPPSTRLPARRSACQRSPMAGFVRVTVEDDGPGLPPGDPERLFDKFQRGHDEGTHRRRRVSGSRSASAIVARARRRRSRRSGDPAAARDSCSRCRSSEPRRMTQAMYQVLVVEDDPGIRNVLRVLLEAAGLSRRGGGDRARGRRSRRAPTSPTCCSWISGCRMATGWR